MRGGSLITPLNLTNQGKMVISDDIWRYIILPFVPADDLCLLGKYYEWETQRRISTGNLDVLLAINNNQDLFVDSLQLGELPIVNFIIDNKLWYILHRVITRDGIGVLLDCCIGNIFSPGNNMTIGEIMVQDPLLYACISKHFGKEVRCKHVTLTLSLEFVVTNLYFVTQNQEKVANLLQLYHEKIPFDKAMFIIQSISPVVDTIPEFSQIVEYLLFVSPIFDKETIDPLLRRSDFDPEDIDRFIDRYGDYELIFSVILNITE